MKRSEFGLEGIHLDERELRLPKTLDTGENVADPTPSCGKRVSHESKLPPALADFTRRVDVIALNYRDLGGIDDSFEENVASDPSRAPRRCSERSSSLYNHWCHEVAGHDKETRDLPGVHGILKEEETRRLSCGHGRIHGPPSRIEDLSAKRMFLTLRLEPFIAVSASKVDELEPPASVFEGV